MAVTLGIRRSRAPVGGRNLPDLLGLELQARIVDRLMATAHVGLAYGQPVRAGKVTVVPIGAVAYGFGWGGGGGRAKVKQRGEDSMGGGSGGGGGVRVTPLAYLEIGPKGARLRPVLDWTAIAVAVITVLGPAVGLRGLRALRSAIRRRRVEVSPSP